ncbi:MAG: (d)CMP kinase [Clostridia bacterium]
MNNIVIGIEGYVGAGKSAICRELLNNIPNSIILEGGNLYRAIVYSLLKSGLDLSELKQNMLQVDIKSIMDKLKIQIAIENRQTAIYVDGKKIEEEDLQSANSSIAVSEVGTIANNERLYAFGRNLIDKYKQQYNIIVSGRALMEIYPNLDYHFMITASLDERIKRKSIQYNNKIDLEELKLNIQKRDELQKKAGYYKIYDKTILVDVTDCKTVQDSTNKVLQFIEYTKN